MSVSSPSISANIPDNPLAVSFRLIIGLYSIIPICLLLYWADQTLWNHFLQEQLPSSPGHFLLFQILFGTPHIIASSILLVTNKDYLQVFQRKILLMSGFIILFFGVGSLFIPYKILYIISACWTVFHVLKQQHGIGKGICRLPSHAFYLLLGLSVAAGIAIYMGIFLKNSLTQNQADGLKTIASGLTLILIFATVYSQRFIATTFGKAFMWANTLLIVSSFFLYSQQYYFLAILIPRLVHDATAYFFYVVHDYNKHHKQPQNWLYQLTSRVHLPIYIVLPVLSFMLTYLLQAYSDELINWISLTLFGTKVYKAITLGLLGYLALMHYYTESFMWTADSPLRRYIRFKR